MSEQQTKEAAKLFDKYAEAKTWWEGLSNIGRGGMTYIYFGNKHLPSELTIGQITKIWEAENKEKPDHLKWWDNLNYNTKKKYSEGYIMPTESPADPLMFLDEETIKEIWEKETQQNTLKEKQDDPHPTIYVEQPVKNLEEENKILRAALSKINDYPLNEEVKGMHTSRILTNIISIAQVALYQTDKNNSQG